MLNPSLQSTPAFSFILRKSCINFNQQMGYYTFPAFHTSRRGNPIQRNLTKE